jgi:glycine/D-amino acid oxidase-like deaminating enzyme
MAFTRRQMLKLAALAAGGATAAAMGIPIPGIGRAGSLPKNMEWPPNDSYWAKVQPPANPALEEDLSVDVAIVGGGYTGLSAAYHLANANPSLKIAVLEARQVGYGASGRNGGMVLPQTGAEAMEIAEDEETHKLTYDLTVGAMKSMKKLVDSTGVDCGLRLDGYLYAILTPEDVEAEEEYVAKAQKIGIPLQLLDREETIAKLGTEAYAGAILDPSGGQVHALKLVLALKRAAEKGGAKVYENSPVMEIEDGREIRLKVGSVGKQVLAKAMVLATNAYTMQLGYFQSQIIPVHAQCGITPPLDAKQQAAIGWKSRLPYYDSRNFLYHLVMTDDQRIVIGGGNAEYFYGDDLHYQGDLARVGKLMLDELVRLYPALSGIQFESVWNGLIDVTFDGLETVGVMGEHQNIYYGLGYNGHGITTTFLFGQVIASLYNKTEHGWQDTAYPDVPLRKFPPGPLKWAGVKTMMEYLHRQDRRTLK